MRSHNEYPKKLTRGARDATRSQDAKVAGSKKAYRRGTLGSQKQTAAARSDAAGRDSAAAGPEG